MPTQASLQQKLPHVVVTRQIPAPILGQIAQSATLTLWEGSGPIPRENLLARVPGCAGIYCLLTDPIDETVLEAAGSGLRVVSQMAVGFDNIDVATCTRRGIPVGNTPGVLTETTADLALALLLASARRIVEAAEFVKDGQWKTWDPMGLTGPDVYGSTVGIIGLGRIGKAVARRLRGFGCQLLYTQPLPDPEAATLGAGFVALDTLLAASDFVTLHCPLNEQTHHLINSRTLSLMKPTAILINTTRGPVVDQTALHEALLAGTIAGAGLDVTDPEPMSSDDPLLGLPSVVVLPHIGSASVATRTRMARMAADNLIAGLKGKPLPNCVNPEVYK